MRIHILCSLIFTLVSSSVAGNYNVKTSSQCDLFPLKSSLHYTYDYYSISTIREVVVLTELTIDSGIVEYIVHDSSMVNDTTILWSIEERQSIFHNDSISYYGRKDTSYWIFDTTYLYITETTSGLHTLISNGKVWQSPLCSPLDTQSVFRYSDSSSGFVGLNWYNSTSCAGGHDTSWFSDKLGLIRRSILSYSGLCHNTHSNMSTEIILHDVPVLSVNEMNNLAIEFNLKQNFPNPFNPTTTISYILLRQSHVVLRLYDVLGRKIKTLLNERQAAGQHSFILQMDNLSSGAYFYQLQVGNMIQTKKLIVLK